jgi:hypothetical protein
MKLYIRFGKEAEGESCSGEKLPIRVIPADGEDPQI